MTDQPFAQFVLLLGAAVLIVATFHRLRIPSSLGYLLVGIVLGPHTGGPVVEPLYVRGLAEFGIVFLLFTIGLNFSLPQIYTLRHLVLGLGTAQIALTAATVGVLCPLILDRLGRDPVMGSSILLTAITDSMGFFIFLALASLLLL